MKVTLVFLTWNEIEGLYRIFDKVPLDAVDECIAVDGGSDDGTIEFFKKKQVPVYIQEIKGRGEAFRLAFREASGDALIFFSPDGNEDPKDIPRFRSFFESGSDLVIATRMTREAHNEEDDQLFKWRKWVNNIFSLIANIIWNRGPYVTDTINGFRGITKKAWNQLNPDGWGYTIEYQSSIQAFKKGLKISEFPTHEYPRIDDRVGSPSIPTGIAFLKLLFLEIRRDRMFF